MLGRALSASTTSATHLLTRGAHPRSFEESLGHSTICTTFGTYALLEQYVRIDLDWLFDLWPVVAMLGGFAGVYLAENAVLLPWVLGATSDRDARPTPDVKHWNEG